MPLLKSRKSIYSLYQRLGDDDESGVEEEYEKFSSTGSSEFRNIDQNHSENSASEKSIGIHLTNNNSALRNCNKSNDHGINKNVNETITERVSNHVQEENKDTSSIVEISNLSIDNTVNVETNDQKGTSNCDIYDDVTEENIYAYIDEDIYATVNDSIDNNYDDDIYATVDDTIFILNKQNKKCDLIVSSDLNDKYNAIAVLDSVKIDHKELISHDISPNINKSKCVTSSISREQNLPRSEEKKILVPVRKAPPPPVKPPVSKAISNANNRTGRKNYTKSISFPPDVIIHKESIYQIPTVKYNTFDSMNDGPARSCVFKFSEKHNISKPKESCLSHDSLTCNVRSASSSMPSESTEVPKNPIYDISFDSPIVQQRQNRSIQPIEAPPLPPKVKVKCEVRPVNQIPVSQSESKLNATGYPDRKPITKDLTSTQRHTDCTPIEDDIPPGCSPQILRDLRHGLMKSERPLRESAIFYTKAQPYPGNHSPGADTKKL